MIRGSHLRVHEGGHERVMGEEVDLAREAGGGRVERFLGRGVQKRDGGAGEFEVGGRRSELDPLKPNLRHHAIRRGSDQRALPTTEGLRICARPQDGVGRMITDFRVAVHVWLISRLARQPLVIETHHALTPAGLEPLLWYAQNLRHAGLP